MNPENIQTDYEMLNEVVEDPQETNPEPEIPAILKNNRYTVHNAAEALLPQPPVDYIVERLIAPGTVNLFVGDGGIGKTYALIHQLVCTSMGIDWLGLKTRPVKCLIIDEESGEIRLKRRLSEVMRGEALTGEIPLQFVCIAGFKLDENKDPAIIEALIAETGAELVLFDALQDIMDGDENSKQDVMRVFSSLRRISDHTNAALSVIHHNNKKGSYRGSSAIRNSVDYMTLMSRDDQSGIMQFKIDKIRDGEPFNFAAKPVWSDGQYYMNAVDFEPAKSNNNSDKYVISFLETHGASTIDEIENNADSCTSRTARNAVFRLASLGLLKRVNSYKIGEKAIYDLR